MRSPSIAFVVLTLTSGCGGTLARESSDASATTQVTQDGAIDVAVTIDAGADVAVEAGFFTQDGAIDAAVTIDAGADVAVEAGFCQGCDPGEAGAGQPDLICVITLAPGNAGDCNWQGRPVFSTSCVKGVLEGCEESDAGVLSCAVCGSGTTNCIYYTPYSNHFTAVVCASP